MLPILRNLVTALAGIDPAILMAAKGVGMTPRQSLFKVELPLAAPLILAGIRTATVWVVGITTLSTPIGQTSLGNYIFTGLADRELDVRAVRLRRGGGYWRWTWICCWRWRDRACALAFAFAPDRWRVWDCWR